MILDTLAWAQFRAGDAEAAVKSRRRSTCFRTKKPLSTRLTSRKRSRRSRRAETSAHESQMNEPGFLTEARLCLQWVGSMDGGRPHPTVGVMRGRERRGSARRRGRLWQPVPAAVMARRYLASATSPAAMPVTFVAVERSLRTTYFFVEFDARACRESCGGGARWRRRGRRLRGWTSRP